MASLKDLRSQFPQYGEVSDGDFLMGIRQKFYPDTHPRVFLDSIEGGANAHATIKSPKLREVYERDVTKPLEGETASQTGERLGGSLKAPVSSAGGKVAQGARAALQGLTLGAGDEIVAAGASALSDRTYSEELARERGRLATGREQSPGISTAAEIGGAIALPVGVLGAGSNLLGRSAGAAATGTGLGALYGFNAGEGEGRVDSAQTGALLGGLLGGAAPVAGQAISNTANKVMASSAIRKAAKAAPSRAGLEQQASALFDAGKAAQIPRGPLATVVGKAQSDAVESGMDAMLTPQATRVMDNFVDTATAPQANVSMRDLNVLRRQAQVPAGNMANRTEKALGTKMINVVDDYIDQVAPKLGAQGKEARAMWSTLRKTDQIDEIFKRAEQYASGFENGLKSEFRAILKSPKKQRGFTKTELAAMEKVTNPGLMASLIRQAGRLGVSLDNGSNALGGALGAGFGGATMGPAGAVALPLIGTAARKGSERITVNAANRVADVVRSPNVQLPAMSGQAMGLLDEALFRSARGAALPLIE